MGTYLNPGNSSYNLVTLKNTFVDKSLLIEYTNKLFTTDDRYLCVSRPRRFGKSTDANMLVAYYSKGANSKDIFDHLNISKAESFTKHLNKHNVIYMNMQRFLSRSNDEQNIIDVLTDSITEEIQDKYDNIDYSKINNLSVVFEKIYNKYDERFVFIIDEWDCVFRSITKEDYHLFLDFLRDLLKDQPYVELAYMTGILPIKKYGTQSALNMFREVSMIDPSIYSKFMGFTEEEVKELCIKFNMNFEYMQRWYNGYHLSDDISIYSPRSVVYALHDHKYGNYWTSTETYESLAKYINYNFDGLKDSVIALLSGDNVKVDTGSFLNDMTTFKSKDDVLTLLIHLGYLGYDSTNKEVYIPNYEVTDSFIQSIKNTPWDYVTPALLNAENTLQAIWNQDEEAVAAYIQQAHLDTSIIKYNSEAALEYTLCLALYTAKNYYTEVKELPAGRGFADIAFIPIGDKPAMIVELKWNQEVETALTQIKNKQYPASLEAYKDNLLLVGINYNKDTGEHICKIEEYHDK